MLPLVFALAALAGPARTVALRPEQPAVRFDGWGTSLCWFGNAVGRWPEPQRTQIADALFGPGGLRLTVVRYNIGGGDAPAHHHMPWFRQMAGFEPAPGRWDWTADPGQRWMLEAAVRRGATRLEAFSNSPPYWMTVSGCASGAANPNQDNLAPDHTAEFVDYLTAVVGHFRTAWGISFNTVEPVNEPFTDYWHANGNQEGCHFDRSSQARLIRALRAELDRRGLHDVRIAASDETNYERAIGTWRSFDAATRACIGQINAHAYATDGRTVLRDLARAAGKPLVMSEVDGGGDAPHDHDAIQPALVLAGQVIADLRELQPLRWVFWQAVEDEPAQAQSNQNWGLIHADLAGTSHTWARTKKYYAFGQFTRFIRPGSVYVRSDVPDTAALFDRRAHALVIVTRNATTGAEAQRYDVSAFGPGPIRVEAYRTSATENLARVAPPPTAGGVLLGTDPAQSITTYVVQWEN